MVPDYPSVIGSVDAAKPGMGGVLFAPGHPLTLWYATFSLDIQLRIMSLYNPGGDLTNSDLEQAGILAQAAVAASLYNLRKLTLLTLNNNTAAISRNQKGAVTYEQAAAYLCHLSSLHRQHHHYCHEVSHISGLANEMADVLSHQHDLSDSQLLTLFDDCFLTGQTLVHVPAAAHDAFGSELLSAAETAHHSIMAAMQVGRAYLFDSWVAFTASLSQDPHLSHVPSNLHLNWLIVYTCRYH